MGLYFYRVSVMFFLASCNSTSLFCVVRVAFQRPNLRGHFRCIFYRSMPDSEKAQGRQQQLRNSNSENKGPLPYIFELFFGDDTLISEDRLHNVGTDN